nr:hypothetical protein [Tanacetum cinerariifolium]
LPGAAWSFRQRGHERAAAGSSWGALAHLAPASAGWLWAPARAVGRCL